MADICNVNSQPVTIAFPADGDGIIQILGILPIDSYRLPVADILASCQIFLCYLIRNAAHLFHDLRRIFVWNAVSLHNG